MTFLAQVREVLRVLRGEVPCDARRCDRCGRITKRLTRSQVVGAGQIGWEPPCLLRGCEGRMPRVMDLVPPRKDVCVHPGTDELLAALRKGADR
ncbi:hypothetical protein ACQEU3_47165 [Spirillospora sp. CA-253888]